MSGDVGADVALTGAEREALRQGCSRHTGTRLCGDCESAVEVVVERLITQRVEAAKAEALAVLPTGEQFEAHRRRVRATYSSATDSGYLLGTIDAQEELAHKVRVALDPEARLS